MSSAGNTIFLRLAGPMQSWGTASRFQLRRTDAYPSKSAIFGMILCAKGIRREVSSGELHKMASLAMGIRVDRSGSLGWDYHTAGAKVGIRKAEGGVKITQSTGELETLLSRRQYLYGASFLVVLQGSADVVNGCACALKDPVWPVYLGRKCCIPGEPVFAGTGSFDTLTDALASVPWYPEMQTIDRSDRNTTHILDTYTEHLPGSPPPANATIVYDVPRAFGFNAYGPRWVIPARVAVSVGEEARPLATPSVHWVDYNSLQWKNARRSRLDFDNHLCVFCKAPAEEVHHVNYANIGHETNADLRSLCKTCHDACTMLEYGHDMHSKRIDPADPGQREAIIKQTGLLLKERRYSHRRQLLEDARAADASFFEGLPASWAKEER